MKTDFLALHSLAVGTACCLLAVGAPALRADDSSMSAKKKDNPSGLAAATSTTAYDQSASRLIGQDVKGLSEDGLGQVKDLMIDAATGRIVYALISSGGLLGVGEKIHAVPFAALRPAARGEDLMLAIDRSQWDGLAALREDELDLLGHEDRGRLVFESFQLNWRDETRAGRGLLASIKPGSDKLQLLRATKLTGQQVVHTGQDVGKIEDIVVNQENRRAAILLDPDDEYTGTDQKFIIGFGQLMTPANPQDRLSTALTRADFANATPLKEDWWSTPTGYPYRWSAPATSAAPGYAAVGGMDREMMRHDTADHSAMKPATAGRTSVTLVRAALHSDLDLRAAAKNVIIEAEGQTLVLSGPVNSAELKTKIGTKVADAAAGWRIDNRITVQSVAE